MDEYIERDKAQDGLDNIDWYHVNGEGQLLPGGKSDIETYVPFKAVEEMLKRIPAADVRPVVRGKWKYRGQKVIDDLFPTYACSVCHGVIPADWRRKCNFCPHCGAKMAEGGE